MSMLARFAAMGGAAAAATPTFVSSSKNRVTTAGNTVTAPSGIQNGDLLVAVGFNVFNGLTVTPPSGFNVQFLTGASSNTIFIATKVASSESGDYTWTWSSADSNSIAILVYRNATVVNTVGSLNIATSDTGVATSITPTYEGTLAAVFCIEGGSKTVATPPSGMTQRASHTGSAPCLEIYDLANQPASATSNRTLVWSASDTIDSIQFFVTNEPDVAPAFVASATGQRTSNGTTLTIAKPTGTIEGDLMVSFVSGSGGGTWTGDSGWTEVADQGATPSARVAYKIAGASEASSYTFTCTASQVYGGAILTYRYAAYDAIGTFATGTNPLVVPSVSTTTSQAKLIAFGTRGSSGVTINAPTSMTARVTDNDATSPSYVVCDQLVAKGPTGTRSMSVGSTTNVAGIMLAIKPTRSLT